MSSTFAEQLHSVQTPENPTRGLCVTCLEDKENGSMFETDSSKEESKLTPVSCIIKHQIKIVSDREQLLLNQDYMTVLKSAKLDSLFNQ